MASFSRAAVVPVVLSLTLVAGCQSDGGSASSTGSTGAAASSGAVSPGASGAATNAGTTCPTSNTRAFAKTRFVTDVGLTVGTFHRWIWKPYKQGKFKKGADGRIKATIKGVAIAALDLRLMHNAKKNVQANPTLCKVLGGPIDKATSALDGLKGKITSGDLTSLAALESTLAGIMTTGNQHGLGIKESTDESKESQG